MGEDEEGYKDLFERANTNTASVLLD